MDTERDPNYPSVWQCIGLTLMWVVLLMVGAMFVAVARKNAPMTVLDTLMIALMSGGAVLFWAYDRAGAPFRELFRFEPFPATSIVPLLLAAVGVSICVSEMDNGLRWLAPITDPKHLDALQRGAKEMLTPAAAPLLLAIIVTPVIEEMIFRGVILRGLLNRFRQDHAIAISSILFAVAQVDLYHVILSFFTGLFLAWVFTRTASLWACILVHAVMNGMGWMVVNVLGAGIPGYTDIPGKDVVFQPLWFDALGVACLAVAGYLLWPTRRKV